MVNKIRGYQYIFFLLSIVNTIAKLCFEVSFLTYVIYIFIAFLAITKKMNEEEFLLYSLFIPNKYLQICSIVLFLLLAGKLIKRNIDRRILIFICYITISGIFSCIYYDGFILASIFQIGFYYCIFMLMKELNEKLNIEKIVRNLDLIFELEVLTVVLDFVISKEIGDAIKGTFESAHYLGVFIIIYIYRLFKIKDAQKSKLNILIRLLLAVTVFCICDAKHIIIVIAFSAIVVFILNKLKIKNQLLITSIVLISSIIISLLFCNNKIFQTWFGGNALSTYIFNSNYNLKYRYILKTFEEMQSINGLIGFGPGQFGSQISLTLSKGLAYPWDSSLSSFKYAIEPYSRILSGLFTQWYVEHGIIESSMVLGYPLISFVGMFAELGIVGYVWFFYLLDRIYAGKNKTFMVGFVILTLFDTYFEIASVTVLILMVTAIFQQKGKVQIE